MRASEFVHGRAHVHDRCVAIEEQRAFGRVDRGIRDGGDICEGIRDAGHAPVIRITIPVAGRVVILIFDGLDDRAGASWRVPSDEPLKGKRKINFGGQGVAAGSINIRGDRIIHVGRRLNVASVVVRVVLGEGGTAR